MPPVHEQYAAYTKRRPDTDLSLVDLTGKEWKLEEVI